ncbi:hypothetical protein GGR51DRAFT_356034 [Nemania sp. FL0031]|nr:hypothetical protein GGR51DRAFT_356034 [Nemania sp. FL0031]
MMEDLRRVVSNELGVKCFFWHYPCKMLLYEKGATFKGRGPPGNMPNTFGTLVINLPSYYTGGDVIVRHADEEKVLSTSKSSMSYAFWYSDASYEMLPVESGYRWVAVYSLAGKFQLQRPPRSLSQTENKTLRQTLNSWVSSWRSGDPKPIYYALDHRYPPESFSLAHLKSRDQACVEQLLNAGRDLGLEIFLATLEHENTGDALEDDDLEDRYGDEYYRYHNYYGLDEDDEDSDDEDRYDRVASTLRAKTVYDLIGNEVLSSITIGEDDILQGGDVFDKDTDEEDSDDPDRYLSKATTHRCTISALVIVPPKGLLPLFTSGSPILGDSFNPASYGALNYLINRCRSSGYELALRMLLYSLQKMSMNGQLHKLTDAAFLENLYQLAMAREKPDLINWITLHPIPFPLTVLTWSRQQLDKSSISFERLTIGFSYLLETQKSLNFQYQALRAVHGDIDPNEELLELLRKAASKAASHLEASCSYEDGLALFDLTLYLHDHLELMKSSIIPELIKSCSHLTAFMLGFIHRWRQSMQRKRISLNEAKPIYEELVKTSIRNMSVSDASISSLSPHVVHVRKRYKNQDFVKLITPTPLVTYRIFRPFVISLFQPGLKEQRDMFVEKISTEAKSIPPGSFEDLWIPLLQDLLFACKKLKFSLTDASWQRLYQEVLGSFLLRFVGKQTPNPDPVKKRVACPCGPCRRLNCFLTDPTEMTGRLALTNAQRNHIEHKLSVFGINCWVEKDAYDVVVFKKSRKVRENERLWEKRKLEAAKHLYAFDQEKLRTVLADKYESIMMMSMLEDLKDTATANSSTSSSAQMGETQAPVSKNPAEEMARLEAEMDALVKTTPSSAPKPTTRNTIRLPMTSAMSAQMAHRSAAVVPPRPFALSHTPLTGLYIIIE